MKLLEVQAEIFFNKELKILNKNGFNTRGGSIADIGCGPGFFAQKLKKNFPHWKIIGIDRNEVLLSHLANHHDIETLHWNIGQGEPPNLEKYEIKSVILRLVLQHSHNPIEFLRGIKSVFAPGTRLYIIEEDDRLFIEEPDIPEFMRMVEALDKYGKIFRNNRKLGLTLPKLASQVGLKVNSTEVIHHTPSDVGLSHLLNYFEMILEMIVASDPQIVDKKEIEWIHAGFARLQSSQGNPDKLFISYPQVITVLEIPNSDCI